MAYSAPVPSAPPQNSSGATPNFISRGLVSFTAPAYYIWTVPSGVTGINFIVNGAAGGGPNGSPVYPPNGGHGGSYAGYVTVKSGDQINIWVAQVGQNGAYGGSGGWGYENGSNGQGAGSTTTGGGGGASAVALNGNILGIAGGGGGSGGFYLSRSLCGGNGGSQYGGQGGCGGVGISGLGATDSNMNNGSVYIFYN